MLGEESAVTRHFFNGPGPWRIDHNSVVADLGSGQGNWVQCISFLCDALKFQPKRILHVELVRSYLRVDARVMKELLQLFKPGEYAVRREGVASE
jgi:hypothetical protein